MSKVMLVSDTVPSVGFLRLLRKTGGASLKDLMSTLKNGRPFYECVLFMNDHQERERELKALLDAADREHLHIAIYEAEPDEGYDSISKDTCLISREVLENIFEERKSRDERNGTIGHRGGKAT
jgi:hypothetical protein